VDGRALSQDLTAKVDLQWRLDRIDRIEEQIWSLVAQLGARGMDVVLDLGLAKKKHRDRQRARAAALGLSAKLHFLDVDLPTRVERVRNRNADKRESFAFEVTDEMIRFMEGGSSGRRPRSSTPRKSSRREALLCVLLPDEARERAPHENARRGCDS